jgi:hypothetical protein
MPVVPNAGPTPPAVIDLTVTVTQRGGSIHQGAVLGLVALNMSIPVTAASIAMKGSG